MRRRRNMKFKGLLSLFLTLILLAGTLPGTALAANDTERGMSKETATTDGDSGDTTTSGTEGSDTADTSDSDIVTDVNAGEKSADSTDDVSDSEAETADKDADTTGTGLPEGWSPSNGPRDSNTDVTSYITFTLGKLTGPSGTIMPEGTTDVTFTYGSYIFTISFAVDMAALNSALSQSGLEAGDYFTFTVPTEFKNLSFNINGPDGLVWANVTTDANGAGKLVFTGNAEGKASVSGNLSFSGSYTETTAGVSNTWEFVFDNTYTFGGTSEGKDTGVPTTNYVSDTENLKSGLGNVAGTNAYGWLLYVNQSADSWTGVITVSDDLGSGHKMTTYAGVANVKYAYYGLDHYDGPDYYGRTNADMDNYYFGIALIDWATMRADYNSFVQWSVAKGKSTLWVDKGDGSGYVDSGYTLTAEADGITVVTTSYMRGRMIDWMDSSNNLRYVEQYTGGLDSVTVTDSGFAIEFPAGVLDGKGVYMSYYSELTAIIPPAMLKNNATISGAGDDKTVTSSNTIKASGTITGTVGEIAIYKFDSNEQNRLSGAKFQLTESSILYDATQTTDTNGYAVFTLSTSGYAGNYTLTEITPPAGYAALDPMSITIDAAGAITAINGTTIPASAANGTIIYDSANNAICKVSPDRLFMVLYNQEEEESTTTRMVTKVWDDTNDQDGKRPTSIQVQLKADGADYGSAVPLNAGNNWTYTWSNLPEKSSGQTVTYTVEESGVPTGYTSSTSENGGTFTITNSYTPGETSRMVAKVWEDANNYDGIRPESIQVQLYADGTAEGSAVTLNEENGWCYIWNSLPERQNGEEIVYTVEETEVPSEYEASYSSDGFTITNTYRPQIFISKVNSAGDELTGAILTIYEADSAGKATDTIATDKDGQELTWETTGEPQDITGIPAGTYILHETTAPRGYYVAYDILFTVNADGTVTKDSATGEVDGNTIIMTDLRYGEVMPEWVALTIGKTVTGTAGDQEQEFTFNLNLTYADGEEVTEEFAYDGSRTGTIKSGESVKLKHGELIRIYDIPLDVEYTVTESDNEGYEVEGKNAVGTIDEIGRSVQFTNHKDKSGSVDNNNGGKTTPTGNSAVSAKTYSKGSTTTGSSVKTGDTAPLMLYGILLLIAGVGIVGFLRYRKKRKA